MDSWRLKKGTRWFERTFVLNNRQDSGQENVKRTPVNIASDGNINQPMPRYTSHDKVDIISSKTIFKSAKPIFKNAITFYFPTFQRIQFKYSSCRQFLKACATLLSSKQHKILIIYSFKHQLDVPHPPPKLFTNYRFTCVPLHFRKQKICCNKGCSITTFSA